MRWRRFWVPALILAGIGIPVLMGARNNPGSQPGGSNQSVQFNDSGLWGGVSGIQVIPGTGSGVLQSNVYTSNIQTLTDGATVTADASQGSIWVWTIAANTNRTFANPTNPTTGEEVWLQLVNGSGGAYTGTITMGAAFKAAAPAVGASTKSRWYEYIYDGTNWWLEGAAGVDQ